MFTYCILRTVFSMSASAPGWPNPKKTTSVTASGTLDRSGATITNLSYTESISDGSNYSLSISGNIAINTAYTYTAASTTFGYSLRGSAAASAAKATLTWGNCVGTWAPSDPSNDGVFVTLTK